METQGPSTALIFRKRKINYAQDDKAGRLKTLLQSKAIQEREMLRDDGETANHQKDAQQN